MLVDSHCHLDCLDLSKYNGSLSAALNAARDKGIQHFLCIGLDENNAKKVIKIAETFQDVHCSLGVHPLNIKESFMFDWLEFHMSHPKVVAIGETGLDYFYDKENHNIQQESFVRHLDLAKKYKKPVIVHTRSAKNDTLRLIENAKLSNGGILHCFTEDWEMAKAALDLGFYISFSGILTFKSASEIQEVARKIPLDRVLLETDSPYLAPVPYRGKPNFPEFVVEIAKFFSEIRNVSFETICAHTTNNFFQLFDQINLK